MPEAEHEDPQQQDERAKFNIVTVAAEFADQHLTLLRNLSTGLAVAGVIVIARSIKLLTKFSCASEIPARFIERRVSIRGRVKSVTDEGLDVEHLPIYLPLISPLLSKLAGAAPPLAVRLAGVEVTPQGQVWLTQWLRPDEVVWLRLLAREDHKLHCLVTANRNLFVSTCVNEELLRLGLGRTAPLRGLDPHSRFYWKLHKRLVKSERRAERRERGFWRRETMLEKLRQVVSGNVVGEKIQRVWRWMCRVGER